MKVLHKHEEVWMWIEVLCEDVHKYLKDFCLFFSIISKISKIDYLLIY
jgi:hypothetical protein